VNAVATEVKFLDKRSLTQVKRKIKGMRERAQNVTPAWQALLDWWTRGNTQHFGTRGGRWRTPWPELSPGYLADKRADGWMGDILVRTSDLRRSLTDRPLPIESLTPRELVAGTNVKYAAYHQNGWRREGHESPRRQLVNAAQVRAEGAVSGAVVNWIVRGEQRVSALEVRR